MSQFYYSSKRVCVFFLGWHQPHRPDPPEEEDNGSRAGRLYGAHLAKILLRLQICYSECQKFTLHQLAVHFVFALQEKVHLSLPCDISRKHYE